MTEETKSQAWWFTLPGILTAAAAVITAISGLIVGLHQAGIIGGSGGTSAVQNSTSVSASTSSATTTASPAAMPASIKLALSELKLGGFVYKILSAKLERTNMEKLTLRLSVRMTNNDPYPANFWDDSFRLLVDEIPRAPVSGLNKVVSGHSADEGEVVFNVPTTTHTATLQVRRNEEVTQVPLQFK